VPEFAARAAPVVLDVKGDELLDPAGAEVRVCTGVVVAMIPVPLDHVDASTLVLIAVAKDDASLLKTCVNGGGRAVPVIPEMAADVNTSVVASLVDENEVLLLELAANADVEGLVPSAVLVNAVSATVEGSEGSVFDTLAVLEASPHVVSVTVEGSGVPEFAVPAAPGGLDVGKDELLDPAGAEVRAETGVVVAMIPVLLDHVDAGALVPIAVAKDGALLLKTCANGVGGAALVIPEIAADVNTSVVALHVLTMKCCCLRLLWMQTWKDSCLLHY